MAAPKGSLHGMAEYVSLSVWGHSQPVAISHIGAR